MREKGELFAVSCSGEAFDFKRLQFLPFIFFIFRLVRALGWCCWLAEGGCSSLGPLLSDKDCL